MVAEAYAEHDPATARRLLRQAVEALAGINVDAERGIVFPNNSPYPDICAGLVRAGDTRGALELYGGLPPGIDRTMAASRLADALDATGSDVSVAPLLFAAADDDGSPATRTFALAALTRRGHFDAVLERYRPAPDRRTGLVHALIDRADDETALDTAWQLLRELGETSPLERVEERLIGALLRRERLDDAAAVLARITDSAARAQPVAWCAAELALHGREDEAATLIDEAIELLPQQHRGEFGTGAALGRAIRTLHGRSGLVASIVDSWAAAPTLGAVIRWLPATASLVDDNPALSERLADGYTSARTFLDGDHAT
jgi:hypothetical protein